AVASEGKGVFETFRGVSHLLMEKVTRDLRRTPGATPRGPSAPAAEEPTPSPVSPVGGPPRMPAPQAPAQAIRREVQLTPPPAAAYPSSPEQPAVKIDYGTEIELPSASATPISEKP